MTGKKALPVEVRRALAVMDGFKHSDEVCPICEQQLYKQHDRDTAYVVMYDHEYLVTVHAVLCPDCGFYEATTKITPALE